MTDLVERLRALAGTALAEDMIGTVTEDTAHKMIAALREAADALTETWNILEPYILTASKDLPSLAQNIIRERNRDINKCHNSLAEAETACVTKDWAISSLTKERDEARAEAAALREVLTHYADDNYFGVNYVYATEAREALSQPGPGAALLEEHKRLQETTQWQAERMKTAGIKNLELSERVKKLEAALRHYAKEETYQGMTKTHGQWELLTREALAALDDE